jgi:hypothetical protein
MPSECVDGARKPPKYLDDGTSKVTKFEFHRDVISLQRSGNHKKDIQNFTVHGSAISPSRLLHRYINIKYSNKIIEPQASNERQIQDHKEDPFEKVFNEVIDSNFFYTEISSYDFGDQASERIVLKGNDSFIPFSNTEHSAWTEIASNEFEDSEIGTPFKPHEHARDETCSGFAISSGWSSTFFPHGIEGEPFNCARKEPQSPSFWYAHE